jgi:hypothetical protein
MIVEINPVYNTADCIIELNKNIKKSNWKRIKKFKITIDIHNDIQVRIFTNGTDIYSVYCDIDENYYISSFDLSSIINVIKSIQNFSKTIYTHDCGEIFLNPFTMNLWISGGDGGICQSNLPKSEINNLIEEEVDVTLHKNIITNFDEIIKMIKLNIPEINNVEIEAECNPDEIDYIIIANCNLLY